MENTKNNIWKIGSLVGILLAVFLLVISIKEIKSIAYVGKDTPVTNVITVNGKGEQISKPDIATFSFGVTENSKSVGDAQDKATTKINNVLDAIKKNGVDEKDIKTLSYNINPRYDYIQETCAVGVPCRSGRQVLSGYEVSQTIQIKVRDLKKAGNLFETVGSLGVQNVNGLTFSIDDIDKVKAEARDIAIKDAKDKAKILAKELGVTLVRITNFYDSSEDQIYPYARESMASDMMIKTASAPVPSVPAGEQKVTSTVSITYEIR